MAAKRAHAVAAVALVVSTPASGEPTVSTATAVSTMASGARGAKSAAGPNQSGSSRGVPAAISGLLPHGPGPFDARVGAWVEYVVRSRGTNGRVRISVIDLKPAAITIETGMFGDSGLPFAARLRFRLQEPDRGRREAARPERASQCLARLESAVVYLLGVAPLELPVVDLAGAFDGTCPQSDASDRRVTVTVPAGTFAAEELPGADGERLWVARDVPLWGLVRAESRRVRVELVGFGWSGARSVLPAQGTGSDNTNE